MTLSNENQGVSREADQENKAVLTIYTCRSEQDQIIEYAKELFKEVMEEFEAVEDSFTIKFHDQTGIKFYILSDGNQVIRHTMGMEALFSEAPLENEQVKKAALLQMGLFKCIIGIEFMINDNKRRTNYIVNTIYMLAQELEGFVLHPNMCLFHSSGKLLISLDGKTDYEEFYAESSSDMLDKDIEPTADDIARQERSIKILKEKGIPYIEHLKASAFEQDTVLQDKEEIIKRLVATYATCVQAEVYTCGRYKNPKEKMAEELSLLEEQYGVSANFSDEETDYIMAEEGYEEKHNLFGWRYECCAIFLWALSLIELQEPDELCDVSELGEIIWNNTFESLMDKSTLRTKQEILDFQDLVLRYNWACVDARIQGTQVEGLNSGVIYFWHYALNWLLQVDGITDWDEITPNT